MTTEEKIKYLIANCKASFSIDCNSHRDYYESAKKKIEIITLNEELSDEVKLKMIDLDSIIQVQAYPTTPVGFYVCYHYDLDFAVNAVYEAVYNELNQKQQK